MIFTADAWIAATSPAITGGLRTCTARYRFAPMLAAGGIAGLDQAKRFARTAVPQAVALMVPDLGTNSMRAAGVLHAALYNLAVEAARPRGRSSPWPPFPGAPIAATKVGGHGVEMLDAKRPGGHRPRAPGRLRPDGDFVVATTPQTGCFLTYAQQRCYWSLGVGSGTTTAVVSLLRCHARRRALAATAAPAGASR